MTEAVQVTMDGGPDEVRDFSRSASAGARWLGTPVGEPVRAGLAFRLPVDSAVFGVVAGVDGDTVTLNTAGGTTTIRLLAGTSPHTTIAVVEPSGCFGVEEARLRDAWTRTAQGLALLRRSAAERRKPRQAVVVIHGIGEQRPGSVLRGFVGGVVDAPKILSKPDDASGDYELRRLQLFLTPTRPRTDFFELYWADKVRDTTKSQVWGWIRGLVVRWPWQIPKRFRSAWWAGFATLFLAGLAVWKSGVPKLGKPWLWVATAASAAVTAALVKSVGDAARYLAARPDNLAIRRDIRKAGVELLRHLHDSGRYHRVVVVGHSLGSVIGYDVLRLYWAEVHDRHGSPAAPATVALDAYEQSAAATTDPAAHQALQHALWRELRANGVPWLVTDFVTAGSPLTHAEMLLTTGPADLAQRKKDRELPTCPPEPDDGSYSYPVEYAGGALRALHHGALFGPVRWTNLYFPTTAVFFGDAVGGQIGPALGRGVRDVAVTNKQWSKRRTPKAHSSYWLRSDPVDGQARTALIEAMGLECAAELEADARTRPLASFLPKAGP